MTASHPHFIPDGASRQDTAVLLIAAVRALGVDSRAVRATRGGFWVTEEVAEEFRQPSEPEEIEPEEIEPEEIEPEEIEPEEIEPEEIDDAYDPADYTVIQVQEFASAHPQMIADLLAAEQDGKNRSTLVEWLNNQASGDRAEKDEHTENEE